MPTKQLPLCQPCQSPAYKAGLAVGRLAAGVVGHVRREKLMTGNRSILWARCARGSSSRPEWRKWRACDPTSAHWYDQARFEPYMAAHIGPDQDLG